MAVTIRTKMLKSQPVVSADSSPECVRAEHIENLLGGEALVGRLRSDMDVILLVREGVPTGAVRHFADQHLGDFGVIDRSVLPRRTFKRREETNQRLDPLESDRLLRLVRLFAFTKGTFASSEKALTWLSRPTKALQGQTPISLSDTDHGVQAVETLLGRIAHGIAA